MSARTRIDSVENFLENSRVSVDGFASDPSKKVDIYSTFYALEISNLLGFRVNDSLDILYYIQRLQNKDGGFGETEDSSSAWEPTIFAVNALRYLKINASQILPWNIYPFINETSFPLLYQTIENNTQLANLNHQRMRYWYEYLVVSTQLGIVPNVPVLDLINELQSLQNNNGTYADLEQAIYSSILLNVFGETPRDPDLAAKFILAHVQTNGIFAYEQYGMSSMNASRWSIKALESLNALDLLETKDTIIRYVLNRQVSNSGFAENEVVSMQSTWTAITILSDLSSIDELFAPDVLQEVGFVYFPALIVPILLISVGQLRRMRR